MYTSETATAPRTLLRITDLRRMKAERQPISMLTAYDSSFAAVMDAQGVELILIGDSLGMVVQGHRTTLPVTVDDIAYHVSAVARGNRYAMLVADMPFLSYATVDQCLIAGRTLMAAGAAMLKLEGAGPVLDCIRALSERDVPVCAHLGLTPQSVHKLGGFKVQGREQLAAERLRADARAVVEAGADLLVLECVPSALASEISSEIAIPTIGIGAGPGCDGQVLVLHDLIGVSGGRRPRFVKDFLKGRGSIAEAVAAYVAAVRAREFPAAEHGYE